MLNVSEQNVEEIMQYVYEKLNEGLPLLESGEMIVNEKIYNKNE